MVPDEIRQAEAERDAATGVVVSLRGQDRVHAEERLADTQARVDALYRKWAAETGEECVVTLDAPSPAADVSEARLLQTEYDAFLLYAVRETRQGGPVALIDLSGCTSRFGLPNDEALRGHPLLERGLRYYAAGEVLNSRWRAREDARNQIAFPESRMTDIRHLVFTFHDSTLECLTHTFRAELLHEPYLTVLRRIAARIER